MLLAGLPGSGKTIYLCEKLHEGWLVFDDFKANAFDDDSYFSKSRKFPSLTSALAHDLKCVVADIDFCDPASRNQAENVLRAVFPQLQLVWHFFENNPAACKANVRRRNNRGVNEELEKLRKYAGVYEIPQGAVILPVFQNPS
jgi:predicted kinase